MCTDDWHTRETICQVSDRNAPCPRAGYPSSRHLKTRPAKSESTRHAPYVEGALSEPKRGVLHFSLVAKDRGVLPHNVMNGEFFLSGVKDELVDGDNRVQAVPKHHRIYIYIYIYVHIYIYIYIQPHLLIQSSLIVCCMLAHCFCEAL
jgi:hypothetical protein